MIEATCVFYDVRLDLRYCPLINLHMNTKVIIGIVIVLALAVVAWFWFGRSSTVDENVV